MSIDWIPGHVDIAGNAVADAAAGELLRFNLGPGDRPQAAVPVAAPGSSYDPVGAMQRGRAGIKKAVR